MKDSLPGLRTKLTHLCLRRVMEVQPASLDAALVLLKIFTESDLAKMSLLR